MYTILSAVGEELSFEADESVDPVGFDAFWLQEMAAVARITPSVAFEKVVSNLFICSVVVIIKVTNLL